MLFVLIVWVVFAVWVLLEIKKKLILIEERLNSMGWDDHLISRLTVRLAFLQGVSEDTIQKECDIIKNELFQEQLSIINKIN